MRQTPGSAGRLLLASVAMLTFGVTPALGQLQSAGSAHLGTANNYTARARGFAALGLNPAALGLESSPGFSLALLPVRVQAGFGPITLADVKDYEGQQIPDATKNEWLSRISADGGQHVLAGARATALSMTIGHFGLQASTIGSARAHFTEPVAELLLFGNAGRTGNPENFSLTGSSMDAWAVTTVGVSVGIPLPTLIGSFVDQSFSIGATLKYEVGNVLMMGRERGGSVSSDPLEVDVMFPVVQTDTAGKSFNNGTGVGLDVGAAWEGGPWSMSFALRNLFNTFKWDQSKLFFRPGEAVFNTSDKTTNFDAVRAEGAPGAATLLSEVADQKFNPTVVAAAAYDLSATTTVVGEIRNRFGDGLDIGPKTHVGVGIEFRPVSLLYLRAGAAKVTAGTQLAAGASLVLGPVNLSGAYLNQSGGVGDASFGQFTLSFGGL